VGLAHAQSSVTISGALLREFGELKFVKDEKENAALATYASERDQTAQTEITDKLFVINSHLSL